MLMPGVLLDRFNLFVALGLSTQRMMLLSLARLRRVGASARFGPLCVPRRWFGLIFCAHA
jgi:hypothetical protein